MTAAEIVSRMQAGDQAAAEELYAILLGSPGYYLRRRLGAQDNEDRVHELYLLVSRAILERRITAPAALYGYIWTVARHQAAYGIAQTIRNRRLVGLSLRTPDTGLNAEEAAIAKDGGRVLRRFMGGLRPRSREVLNRFYLQGQERKTIEREMGLSPTLYRLLKSRAVGGLRELVRAGGLVG